MRFLLLLLLVVALLYPGFLMSPGKAVAASPITLIVVDIPAATSSPTTSDLVQSTLGLLTALHQNPRIAFITFTSDVAVRGPMPSDGQEVNSTSSQLYEELAGVQSDQGSNLAAALTEAYNLLSTERATAGSAIYLISQGMPSPEANAQRAKVRSLLKLFDQKGWLLNPITLPGTPSEGEEFLSASTDPTGGEYLEASFPTGLKRIADNLLRDSDMGSLASLGEGSLTPWELLSMELPITPRTREVALVVFREDASNLLRLLNVSDQEMQPGDTSLAEFIETPHVVLWKLKDPEPGSWQVQAQGMKGKVFSWHNSINELKLVLESPSSSPLNEPTVITASVTEGGQRVLPSDVEFLAHVTFPEVTTIVHELNDRGEKGDRLAGDGFFSVSIPSLAQQGNYQVVLELLWPDSNSRLSSLHQFRVEAFPQVVLEPFLTEELTEGEATRIASIIVHVQGDPYPVTAKSLIPQVISPSGASIPAEVRPEHVIGEGRAWRYDAIFTPQEQGPHTFSLRLNLNYLGREYIYSSESLVLDVTLTPPGPVVQPQGGISAWAIAALVTALIAIFWVLLWAWRTSPFGYLYSDGNQEITNFSHLKRSRLGSFLFKSSIRGKELGIPGLEGVVFRFSRKGVQLTYNRASPTLRVNNHPLLGTVYLGVRSWIGSQGKLYTFLLQPSAPGASGNGD